MFGFYLLVSDFLAESLKANKSQKVSKLTKTSNIDHSFYNTVLHSFWLLSEKNLCTAPFLDIQQLNSRIT